MQCIAAQCNYLCQTDTSPIIIQSQCSSDTGLALTNRSLTYLNVTTINRHDREAKNIIEPIVNLRPRTFQFRLIDLSYSSDAPYNRGLTHSTRSIFYHDTKYEVALGASKANAQEKSKLSTKCLGVRDCIPGLSNCKCVGKGTKKLSLQKTRVNDYYCIIIIKEHQKSSNSFC